MASRRLGARSRCRPNGCSPRRDRHLAPPGPPAGGASSGHGQPSLDGQAGPERKPGARHTARRPPVQCDRSSVSSGTCASKRHRFWFFLLPNHKPLGKGWSSRVLIKGPVVPEVLNVHTRTRGCGTSQQRVPNPAPASMNRGQSTPCDLAWRDVDAPAQQGHQRSGGATDGTVDSRG